MSQSRPQFPTQIGSASRASCPRSEGETPSTRRSLKPHLISYVCNLVFLALLSGSTTAWGQSTTNQPQIGYLYPSGAQCGQTIQIVAGGQVLRGTTDVYISGKGVHASVVQYIRPLRNIQKEQRELLQNRLKEVQAQRLAELPDNNDRVVARDVPSKDETLNPEETDKAEEVELPDHPLLIDLDNKSLRELEHVRSVLFFPRRKQQINRQLSEMVLIEITVDADAIPGDRELRIQTKTGLTNPVIFQIGTLPEVCELEPNDQEAYPQIRSLPRGTIIPTDQPLNLPVVLNGQMMPGDVDRFRFIAKEGQQLVIETSARRLIPYLADAVPGWFQATLALYDADGREVAFDDDFRFNPDPVMLYKIPKSGEYELEIHDSIYRGREDFVYRIAIGELPFITEMSPLGGRLGAKTVASISGWNLPKARLRLDTEIGDTGIERTAFHQGNRFSNTIPYAVDELPECTEDESNDTIDNAQAIVLPRIVNGCISTTGDIDVFRFEGKAGDDIVAEVSARRLNSPLDSLVRLTDAAGEMIQWNDDYVVTESHLYIDITGLLTHHADSYLTAKLPSDGTYFVHLADSQRHGGQAYGYRLRITTPQPDFALRVTPSSLSLNIGATVPVTVHALRKDGYTGPIEVALKDPWGFELSGGIIPAGKDRVRMTVTAPPRAIAEPVALEMEGRAQINGKQIAHRVVPADDVMQAFLYRHLVPAQELLVAVRKVRWKTPPVQIVGSIPVRLTAGFNNQIRIKTQRGKVLNEICLELNDPPKGVTLGDLTVLPNGLAFEVKVDKIAIEKSFTDNLIVEVFREWTPQAKDGQPAPTKQRTSLGVFPAIPIEVVL